VAGQQFDITVNGSAHGLDLPGDTPPLDVLGTDLGLLGTRTGCLEGECGACSVLVDGQPVQACQTPLWSVAGRRVETIEGLRLEAVREASLAEQAAQCGYYTNGIIMTIAGLLGRVPVASRCRSSPCWTSAIFAAAAHARILRALDRAVDALR
jgi:aerobic-type carbon monoxide dehydrogenase small subunit (CoxS/CutS family)